MKNLKLILVLTLILSPSKLFAADITIEMLNRLDNESMVFSQKVSKVNIGDTIFWKSTDKGHNVEFIKGGVPAGVEKFKSKISKDAEYTFTIPGIYAFWCTPHKSMGMIALVIVGDDTSNKDAIAKAKAMGKSKKKLKELLADL